MKAIELYKFVTDNNIEYHYAMNEQTIDVIIFPYYSQVDEFVKLLDKSIFDEEGISCHMKDGYLAIWMDHICEYYGIEISDVFKK